MHSKKYLTYIFLISMFFPHFVLNIYSQNKPYKGAELYSLPDYYIKYGKIEVRMMAAKGSGILSTFFTWKEGSEQPNVFWEEIDVEVFGKNNATSWQSNIITGFDPRTTSEEVHNQTESLGDEFHTYCVEWTPNYVAWKIDEELVRITFSTSAQAIKNLTGIRFNIWASTSTAWAGDWNENVLPQYQYVNWIKYYHHENGNFILDWTDDFDELNKTHWGKANWTFDDNRADFDPDNIVVKDGMLILCLTKAGETGFNGIVPIDSADISTDVIINKNIFKTPMLNQNYPNPFNPSTIISYSIPKEGNVTLKLYDSLGEEIKVLVNENKLAGHHQFLIDGKNLSNGVYFYTMQTDDFSDTKKLLLLK